MRGVQQQGRMARALRKAPVRVRIRGFAPMAASSGHGAMPYFSAL